MKRLLAVAFLLAGSGLWADTPRLALADFTSSTMEKGKLALVTEAFRSELFQSGLFSVQDQPWTPGSPAEGLQKGASGSIESFGNTWVVSVKVADLATGALDFSETASVTDEAQVFRAIKELTSQLSARFRYGVLASQARTPEEKAKLNAAQWTAMGATGQVLVGLTALGESTETYLSFRQYDGTITPAEYLDLRRQTVDLEALRTFLQAGISYREARQALSMGILRLEKYQLSFRPADLEFSDYLEAYSLGFSTPKEYKQYLADSRRDFLSLGMGGAADAIPVGTTDFKFLIGQVAWEHSWMKSPKEWYRVNTEAGLILLGLFLPTPYAGINVMAGSAPFFIKAGIGAHAEMLVGGHAAFNLRLGIEVASQYEFTLLAVPFGTQPVVNYVGGFKKWEGGPDGPIRFPYYGLLFTYKQPLATGTP